ncbi:hypothetical protein LCGC14_2130820 [marine sediment metagenome]|uniref:HNH nuclease domain-containing protein n=1 Tax=marine sediment metagenome TaxID=412755 RepID=A0A0F9GXN2_9ZZZZ
MNAILDRFMEKVEKDSASDCWLWTASTVKGGYGQFTVNGWPVLAHRWIYEETVGKIPDGKELDHLCSTPSCVNYEHLEPVVHAENIRRGNTGKNQEGRGLGVPIKSYCPQGHPYAGDNLYIYANARGGINQQCRTCNRERQRVRRVTERTLKA